MMKLSLSAFASLAGALPLLAASPPVAYTNTSGYMLYGDPVPQINARAWLNNGTFSVFSTFVYPLGVLTPTSLRAFTNTGSMFGSSGSRFVDIEVGATSSTNYPMSWFVNRGSIAVSDYLSVLSSNLVSSGLMTCNDQGTIMLLATNSSGTMDLRNAGLQAGSLDRFDTLDSFHTGLNEGPSYTNDFQVTDLYWGMGSNNRLGTTNNAGPVMAAQLNSMTNPVTSFISYLYGSRPPQATHLGYLTPATTNAYLPACGTEFRTYVNTNFADPTNRVVQVVMVASNLNYPNLQVNVDFLWPALQPNAATFNGHTSIVQFALSDINIVDDQSNITYVTLFDGAPAVGAGGLYIERSDTGHGTMRPANYELTRDPLYYYYSLGFYGYPASLLPLAPDFFAPSGQHGQSVYYPTADRFNINYSTYSAWLGVINFAPNPSPLISDSTNLHGKVEVFANSLNAAGARIRAESFAGIQTSNLQNNALPKIDAPFVNLDLGSTNGVLVVSNTLPQQVVRFFGSISAYSATWTNTVTNVVANISTNLETTYYHVLIVDNCLEPPPVTLHKFAAHASSVVVEDNLNINNSMLLDAQCLTLGPTASLTLPANWSWGPTNAPGLRCLFNSGRNRHSQERQLQRPFRRAGQYPAALRQLRQSRHRPRRHHEHLGHPVREHRHHRQQGSGPDSEPQRGLHGQRPDRGAEQQHHDHRRQP